MTRSGLKTAIQHWQISGNTLYYFIACLFAAITCLFATKPDVFRYSVIWHTSRVHTLQYLARSANYGNTGYGVSIRGCKISEIFAKKLM